MDHLKLVQVLAPAVALTTSGGILALSYYTSPILRSITARSTPDSAAFALSELRALFSSGSHVFPQMATLSAGLSTYLAWSCPEARASYIGAAVGAISIAPFTIFYMLPVCNGRLIELDEKAKQDKTAVRGKGKEREVLYLLSEFERLNAIRAGLLALGGLIGLWTALS